MLVCALDRLLADQQFQTGARSINMTYRPDATSVLITESQRTEVAASALACNFDLVAINANLRAVRGGPVANPPPVDPQVGPVAEAPHEGEATANPSFSDEQL